MGCRGPALRPASEAGNDEFPGQAAIAAETPASVYLDLENPRDAARLADPGRYLDLHAERLVILDEIQRMPDLFRVLRVPIDAARQSG